MNGPGATLAIAAYAALLWIAALALDAIAVRAAGPRRAGPATDGALASDVARFHRAIGGALLAVGALLVAGRVATRVDAAALLLLPVAGLSAVGALRRVRPLWRDP